MNDNNPISILDNMIQSIQTDCFNDNELLSPKQVGEYLGVHINTIYRIIGTGHLTAYDLSMGNRKTYYRIKKSDIDLYLKERLL